MTSSTRRDTVRQINLLLKQYVFTMHTQIASAIIDIEYRYPLCILSFDTLLFDITNAYAC